MKNSIPKKDLLQKYWTIILIGCLLLVGTVLSCVLVRKKRRETLLEAKFMI